MTVEAYGVVADVHDRPRACLVSGSPGSAPVTQTLRGVSRSNLFVPPGTIESMLREAPRRGGPGAAGVGARGLERAPAAVRRARQSDARVGAPARRRRRARRAGAAGEAAAARRRRRAEQPLHRAVPRVRVLQRARWPPPARADRAHARARSRPVDGHPAGQRAAPQPPRRGARARGLALRGRGRGRRRARRHRHRRRSSCSSLATSSRRRPSAASTSCSPARLVERRVGMRDRLPRGARRGRRDGAASRRVATSSA